MSREEAVKLLTGLTYEEKLELLVYLRELKQKRS